MALNLGIFAETFSRTKDLVDIFEGVTDAEDMQLALHKIADTTPEEFAEGINNLRILLTELGRSELSPQILNYQSQPTPGEAFLGGQEAASQLASSFELDDIAAEIDDLPVPPSFPFHDAEKRLLNYPDGISRAAAHVKSKAQASGVAGTEQANAIISLAEKLDSLAAFYSKNDVVNR